MPLKVDDRTLETTATTGTGSLNLAGAKTGYQTFVAGVGDANTCPYLITDGTNWEVGLGTVTSGAPDQLSRDQVLASSNGDAKVNWGSGSKDVGVVAPAAFFGAFSPSVRTITAGATLTIKDNGAVLMCAGTFTQNLPALSAVFAGWGVTVLILDGSTVTLDGNSSETILGATTKALTGRYRSWRVFSDGAEWKIGASHAEVFTGDDGGSPSAGAAGLVPAPTQGDANKFLRGDGTWHEGLPGICGFHAAPSGDQSGVVTSTWTDVAFATETYNFGGNFSTPSFTAPVDGEYLFNWFIGTSTALADGNVFLSRLLKNATGNGIAGSGESRGAAGGGYSSGSALVRLAAGDTVKLQVFHNLGSNVTLDANGSTNVPEMYFSGARLS